MPWADAMTFPCHIITCHRIGSDVSDAALVTRHSAGFQQDQGSEEEDETTKNVRRPYRGARGDEASS